MNWHWNFGQIEKVNFKCVLTCSIPVDSIGGAIAN